MLEVLTEIEDRIMASVAILSDDISTVIYSVVDPDTFWGAVSDFKNIVDYGEYESEYYDLKIKINSIYAGIRDNIGYSQYNVSIEDYRATKNTIDYARENILSEEPMRELYLINHANSDWDIFSSRYILKVIN